MLGSEEMKIVHVGMLRCVGHISGCGKAESLVIVTHSSP